MASAKKPLEKHYPILVAYDPSVPCYRSSVPGTEIISSGDTRAGAIKALQDQLRRFLKKCDAEGISRPAPQTEIRYPKE